MMRRAFVETIQAVRRLARSPGFAAVAILTMALGIGLNSALFGVVHSVLLRPLPYEEPHDLVRLANRYLPSGSTGWVSGAEYWEYRQANRTLTASVPLTPDAGNLTGLASPLRVEGLMVGTGFFDLLGIEPRLGRGFLPEEGRPGAEPVVVLGHGLWQTAFGADPNVLDRTLDLGGRTRRVIGVMGPDYEPLSGYLFTGRPEDYLIPVVLDPATFDARSVERHNLLVLARLADDVDAPQAEVRMLEAVGRLEEQYPGISSSGSREVAVTSLQASVVGPVRGTLFLLTAAAGLVLLVACVNVANLFLARSDTRAAEMAVRAAIGAARSRLVGHGLAEGIIVGVAGGALGFVLAALAGQVLTTVLPSTTPIPGGIAFGVPVLLYTAGLTAVAGVLAGLPVAVRIARGNVFAAIKAQGSDERPSRRSLLRRGLVVGQMAGAVILVSSAALLLRSIAELRAVDTGFDAEGLHGIQISATGAAYPEAGDVRRLYTTLERQVTDLPAVRTAAASWQTPLQSGMSDWPVQPRTEDDREWQPADPNLVGPDFFRTYDIDLLEGRPFEESDMERAVGPVILNRTGARRLFGDDPAVGRFVNLSFGEPVWREVIGIVEDVRGRGLAEEPRIQTYMTYGEGPFGEIASLVLNLRTEGSTGSLRQAVQDIVWGLDPDIPIGTMESMEDVVAGSLERERLLSLLLTVFAAVALGLGAIGVYGVVSYSVSRRTREIGLRIAVGAKPGAVIGLVLRQGIVLGSVGIIVGVVGSLAAARLLEGFLFGVSGSDVPTLVAVAAGVLGVACLASLLPARRASSVDPLVALRD